MYNALPTKKKRYSIKVDDEVGGSEDKAEATAEPENAAGENLDPAEFARQERLRKQREKQVVTELLLRPICYLY